jgi:hypothetical protein
MGACVCSIRFSSLDAAIGLVFALHSPLALLRLAEGQPSSIQRAMLSSGRRELWRFLEVVQEILGHSLISITLDVYSQVLPTMQEEVMKGWVDDFGAGGPVPVV